MQSLRIWKLQGGNFDRMREESVLIWNVMLSGYAQNWVYGGETLRLFNDMLRLGVRPNERLHGALSIPLVLHVVIFPWLTHW